MFHLDEALSGDREVEKWVEKIARERKRARGRVEKEMRKGEVRNGLGKELDVSGERLMVSNEKVKE